MTPLLPTPESWVWATLGEIADVVGGVTKDTKKQSDPAIPLVPYLRVANVQRGHLDLRHVTEIRVPQATAERLRLQPGDVLLNEGGDRDKLGRGWVWEGQIPNCIHQNHVFRARIHSGILHPKLLAWFANECAQKWFETNGKQTTNLASISMSKIQQLPVPIPPLDEQQRIIEALDRHLATLQTADEALKLACQKVGLLRKHVLIDAVPIPGPTHWRLARVSEVGTVDLGRQRHPDWHTGPNMRPYLRVANVFEDRIDIGDVMEMDFPPAIFERFRLAEDDILLNEGQSPEYLGRPAMYRGEPKDIAFTNSLLRFRAGSEVDPEWALLVFRRHMHAGRFMEETRITTNIAHLSATRFKSVEFPVPPLEEQRAIVQTVQRKLAGVAALSEELRLARVRATNLRNTLLDTAFRGYLVRQAEDDGSANQLLERIAAERATAEKSRHSLRSGKPRAQSVKTSLHGSGEKDSQGTRILPVPPATLSGIRTGEQESLFEQEEVSS
ncbi:restriction endonuclease subunit S [Nonomuraea insulae]|uniref:Restriction endonuclease subunit S n=1 Tax=Nonomuraea insulae TaxID=1616787 RepID=A0ABW1CVR1_9ACTN